MSKPVVHWDTERWHMMPVSGRHSIMLCGIWLQDSYKPDAKRKTLDPDIVTCKNCLKTFKPQ